MFLGPVCSFVMFLSAFYGVLLFTPPLILPAIFYPPFTRWAVSFLVGFWNVFAVAIFEFVLKVKVVVSGSRQKSDPGDSVLIMMNHRTRLDWLFFYSYQLRFGSLRSLKICLKEFLKHLPGPGWAMQTAIFTFLKRRWAQDVEILRSRLQYFSDTGSHPHVLIFPEGTDFSAYGRAISDEYAAKTGRQRYEFVLHPHTTGIVFIVSELRRLRLLDRVLDVTVGYPGGVCQEEIDFVKGDVPQEVHFHIEELDPASLPSEEAQLEAWCRERWQIKEERLKQFYQDKNFPDAEYIEHCNEETRAKTKLYLASIFWVLLLVLTTYLLMWNIWIRLYLTLSAAMFVLADVYCNGIDSLFCYFAARKYKRVKNN